MNQDIPADPAPRVWTCGEALAALVSPSIAPAEHANIVEVGIGGAEFNVAVGLARLGHEVAWIGVVGDDPWGRRVRRELRAEGAIEQTRVHPSAPTGAYFRERRTSSMARATYLRAGSAGSMLGPDDVAALPISRGDVVHVTGLTPAISTDAYDAWLLLARTASERGAIVSLDVNYRSALCGFPEAARHFDAISPFVSLVMASADEASVVTKSDVADGAMSAEEAAARLAARLPESAEVIIKAGATGSLHAAADGTITRAAALAVDVVDLVGAGDAFAAGYLSGLLDNLDIDQRLERGHLCAAFVVATRGDWEGAPRRDELALSAKLTSLEVHR